MNHAKNVLLVDDNPNNLEILHEILESSYRLFDARDGRDALRLAQRLLPRYVLLDVMLPDMDGYEVCRRLRQMSGMRCARIIMVSAKAMPSEQRCGFDAGADAYITKPFDDGELCAVMNGLDEVEDAAID